MSDVNIWGTTGSGGAVVSFPITVAQGGTGATDASAARSALSVPSVSDLADAVAGLVPKSSTTGSALLPSGTTAQRDVSPQIGAARFNSTVGDWEGWNGTSWTKLAAATSSSTIAGDLTFTGTNRWILGDFSNATPSNRLGLKTTTTNGGTYVGANPDGTGTAAAFQAFNALDASNASYAAVGVTSSEARVLSEKTGTGTYLPLAIYAGGSNRFQVGTLGQFGIGGATYGTAGQVLTSGGNSAAPTWSTPSSGSSGVRSQLFTSSGTFTIPAGVTNCKVSLVGGGGGGGPGWSGSVYARGGGGGAVAIKWLTGLTPGNTITVTVGTGGTGGVYSYSNGTAGGSTTITSGTQTITTVTAGGGSGGVGNISGGGSDTTFTSGGTATNGDLNYSGGYGGFVAFDGTTNHNGQGGAAGNLVSLPSLNGAVYKLTGASGMFGGKAADSQDGGQTGFAGTGYGNGGGGTSGTFIGGAGASGLVIFEY